MGLSQVGLPRSKEIVYHQQGKIVFKKWGKRLFKKSITAPSHTLAGTPSPGGGLASELMAGYRRGSMVRDDERAAAVVLDKDATSFLMMGALSPGGWSASQLCLVCFFTILITCHAWVCAPLFLTVLHCYFFFIRWVVFVPCLLLLQKHHHSYKTAWCTMHTALVILQRPDMAD